MEIGAQFYTLRDFCKTLDDFSETLKKVADIGYKTVQISGTTEYEPEWLKRELEKNDLKCVLTHTSIPRLIENPGRTATEHSVFDCEYVGIGYYVFDDEKPDGSFDNYFDIFPTVARRLKESGKYFMYHHHDHEFKKRDGKIILEHIAEKIPADDLGITLDTYWVQAGGGDPGYWLERLKGRVPCIHLKDFGYGRRMEALGDGNINFDRVFKKAEEAGTKYMLVEQDDCNGENPFDCLKRSYEFLKARGF